MIVRNCVPIRIIYTHSVLTIPKPQESRNNCSDGGGCTAQAKRISSGTIEAAGVDHDDMVPPNQQLHFAAFGVADVFQSDFWNWHTHRHIEAKLIDWFLKDNFIWLGELPLLGVLYRFRLGTIGFRSINLGNILFGEVLTDLGNLLHVLEASFLCATP